MEQVVGPIVFGAAGVGIGWVYFAIMRYSVERLTERRSGMLSFAALVAVRAVLLGAGAVGAAMVSGGSLVAYVVGFVVVRTVVVSRARRAGPPARDTEEEARDD